MCVNTYGNGVLIANASATRSGREQSRLSVIDAPAPHDAAHLRDLGDVARGDAAYATPSAYIDDTGELCHRV